MQNAILYSMLVVGLCAAAHAGPVLSLSPGTGTVQGAPGSDVGWGFTLKADSTSWISVVTSALINESNPTIGFYTDLIGLQGGPTGAVLAPGAADWIEAFDPLNGFGIGDYSIDPSAVIGSADFGTIDVLYEIFSADPNTCSRCSTGFGTLDVPFEVDVTAPVASPEASTEWLLVLGLGLILVVGFLQGNAMIIWKPIWRDAGEYNFIQK